MNVAPADRPGRLAVGVVGAGRAGSAMAAALRRAGHPTVAATTGQRNYPLLGDVVRCAADEVSARCQLLLLSVPDDVLPDLVRGLAVTGALRAGQLVVHLSGRHGLAVLSPATDIGALPIGLHPVMTFTGEETDLARMAGAAIGVTTSEVLRAAGEALALDAGGEPVWVPEACRPLWHAALTHGANHLVTLVGQAVDMLVRAGVEHPDQVLGPLLLAALDNTLRAGDRALTGPVARADAGTLAAHLEVLAGDPAYPSYVVLARATVVRALAAGRLRATDGDCLLGVLGRANP